eukprot:11185382-Karenia_brevis.AAC.1
MLFNSFLAAATEAALSQHVKSYIQLDRMRVLSDKAHQIQQLFSYETPAHMLKHIAGYIHKNLTRSTYISNHDGNPAMNIQQHKLNFSAYLQRLVNADSKSCATHIHECRQGMSAGGHMHTCAKAFATPAIDPAAQPSLSDLVPGFSRLKPKALGEG